MLKAIVFDLDGTLLDTLDDLATAVNWTLRRYAMPPQPRVAVRRFLGNGVGRLMESAVPQGSDNPRFIQALNDFKAYYVAHCLDMTRPYPGIDSMLRQLADEGLRLAIVSNKLQSGVTELHQRFFATTVDVAIGEQEGIRRKPAPDMVNAALCQLGVLPSEAVYVGDSEVDILTAQASHLPCISVLWGFRDKPDLIQAGAQTFVATPDGLVQQIHNVKATSIFSTQRHKDTEIY